MMAYPVLVEIDARIWLINDRSGVCAYALGGEERGLLIVPGEAKPEIAERLFDGRAYDILSPRRCPLRTGDTIDLGGRVIRVIRTPALTEGDCSFWDERGGTVFTGDACVPALRVQVPVSDALAGLSRLWRLCPGLLRIYPSSMPESDYRAYPPELLEDAVAALRAALSPDSGGCLTAPGTVRLRSVTLTFDATRLRAPWESPSPYPLGI